MEGLSRLKAHSLLLSIVIKRNPVRLVSSCIFTFTEGKNSYFKGDCWARDGFATRGIALTGGTFAFLMAIEELLIGRVGILDHIELGAQY